MTYAEFLARPSSVNDAECVEIVMRWYLSTDGSTWCVDGECLRGVGDWSPTTDRNATAMLVEETTKDQARAIRFLNVLGRELNPDKALTFGGVFAAAQAPIALITAAPSLVAWACVESCREEK